MIIKKARDLQAGDMLRHNGNYVLIERVEPIHDEAIKIKFPNEVATRRLWSDSNVIIYEEKK